MVDTRHTDLPICPYCGHADKSAWEINFGGVEGDVSHWCPSCGEEYLCSRHALVTYSTEKIVRPVDYRTAHVGGKPDRRNDGTS